MKINTNLSSLIVQSNLKTSTNGLNTAIERMTTGFKINHAKDNAANYSIATNMSTKINSLNVAEDNTAMGLDLVATAEGSLSQIQEKLQRLRDLQEQANNGTYGEQSLQAINSEANALVDEINRLYNTAEYNGLKLFGGESTPATANTTDSEPIQTFSMARTTETITSVGFLNPVEHQDTSSAIAISSLEEGAVFDLSQTYSISSAEDLLKLNTMSIQYCDGSPLKLILTCDIDMSSISNWEGISIGFYYSYIINFEGNGHVISNLSGEQGLFKTFYGSISNLGLENVEINGDSEIGAFAGTVDVQAVLENCYATGTITGTSSVGGLIGRNFDCPIYISSVASSVDVTGSSKTGGFIGNARDYDDYNFNVDITNSQYLGESDNITGILIGDSTEYCNATIESISYNNYYDSLSIPLVAGTAMITTNNTNSVEVAINSGSGSGTTGDGTTTPSDPSTPDKPSFTPAPDTIILQIGASSGWASQVDLSTKFSLDGVEDLRNIGLDTTTDYLTQIDDMLATLREKQTHFGAVSNRLESVLDEIVIKRDNLISSRSTIRDADIAEVSATYIQQQILQQASATLLATANQSPSIALQLL